MSLPAPPDMHDYTPDPYWDSPTPGDTLDQLTDWNVIAELFRVSTAPAHETGAVLRMQRNGWKGPNIAKYLGIPQTTLVDQMNAALEAETTATEDYGQVIYDTSAKPDEQ